MTRETDESTPPKSRKAGKRAGVPGDITDARQKLGMSRMGLYNRAKLGGYRLTYDMISKAEHGQQFSQTAAEALAALLGLDVDRLNDWRSTISKRGHLIKGIEVASEQLTTDDQGRGENRDVELIIDRFVNYARHDPRVLEMARDVLDIVASAKNFSTLLAVVSVFASEARACGRREAIDHDGDN